MFNTHLNIVIFLYHIEVMTLLMYVAEAVLENCARFLSDPSKLA